MTMTFSQTLLWFSAFFVLCHESGSVPVQNDKNTETPAVFSNVTKSLFIALNIPDELKARQNTVEFLKTNYSLNDVIANITDSLKKIVFPTNKTNDLILFLDDVPVKDTEVNKALEELSFLSKELDFHQRLLHSNTEELLFPSTLIHKIFSETADEQEEGVFKKMLQQLITVYSYYQMIEGRVNVINEFTRDENRFAEQPKSGFTLWYGDSESLDAVEAVIVLKWSAVFQHFFADNPSLDEIIQFFEVNPLLVRRNKEKHWTLCDQKTKYDPTEEELPYLLGIIVLGYFCYFVALAVQSYTRYNRQRASRDINGNDIVNNEVEMRNLIEEE